MRAQTNGVVTEMIELEKKGHELKPEFWTQGPNSWDSTCQVQPHSKSQIKRHGEGREKRFIT
jgi:hypothetical protein